MDRPLRARACTRAREIIEEFLPGCMIDSVVELDPSPVMLLTAQLVWLGRH